eukprot:gnl/MRDRNA2_/MRDRNA2_226723_c0_seq1.p1 gnl/MRDRNA2_/MRDRNA2_226723_c0~~gnl/MRDRNA2_/MRDRNA2_226723_c0_seq1.p1  ORF type:complete len:390 (+),score=82.37 gnl/MRDRNA2_/MRDRNA2_226723_c0_seq1:177-1172(+)
MPDGSTYVMTGDIREMWLRDSAAEMGPYIDLLRRRPTSIDESFFQHLDELLHGFVKLQSEYILSDPCSAAFEPPTEERRRSQEPKKFTYINDFGFELDSLLYFLRMLRQLKAAGSSAWKSDIAHRAAWLAVKTIQSEMNHGAKSSCQWPREPEPTPPITTSKPPTTQYRIPEEGPVDINELAKRLDSDQVVKGLDRQHLLDTLFVYGEPSLGNLHSKSVGDLQKGVIAVVKQKKELIAAGVELISSAEMQVKQEENQRQQKYAEEYEEWKKKQLPVKEGIGLIWSSHRPSDDKQKYGYLIPANIFAAAELLCLSDLAVGWNDAELSKLAVN